MFNEFNPILSRREIIQNNIQKGFTGADIIISDPGDEQPGGQIAQPIQKGLADEFSPVLARRQVINDNIAKGFFNQALPVSDIEKGLAADEDILEKGVNRGNLVLKQVTVNGKTSHRWVNPDNDKEHAPHGSKVTFDHEGKKVTGTVGRVSKSSGRYVITAEDGTLHKKHPLDVTPHTTPTKQATPPAKATGHTVSDAQAAADVKAEIAKNKAAKPTPKATATPAKPAAKANKGIIDKEELKKFASKLDNMDPRRVSGSMHGSYGFWAAYDDKAKVAFVGVQYDDKKTHDIDLFRGLMKVIHSAPAPAGYKLDKDHVIDYNGKLVKFDDWKKSAEKNAKHGDYHDYECGTEVRFPIVKA